MNVEQTPILDKNPLSAHRHKSEVLWQIIIPLAIGGLILLFVAVFSAGLGLDDTRRWADISTIWLITSVMVGLLLSLVTLVLGIYVLHKIIQILPGQSFRLLKGLWQVQEGVRKITDQSVQPILGAKTRAASIRRLIDLAYKR